MTSTRHDVLIAGAGPTGLVLALWLTKQGVRVRIIDKSEGPGRTSRAMAVQARTLELYRQLALADDVVAAGRKNPAVNLWVRGKRRARVSLGEAGAGLSPYPFVLTFPQDQHERLLTERLAALGVVVERQTELVGFEAKEGVVVARIRTREGDEVRCEASYLAGCDGARSTVRHLLGAGFPGGTYSKRFYVADVEASGPPANGEVHVAFVASDFVAVFGYGEKGNARLVGTVEEGRDGRGEDLRFDDVEHRALDSLQMRIERVRWFSTYRVHHRVAERFRYGRVFLLGDAAHVHSPAGGQGMNTGIGDAINLAWKLACALQGRAPDALLDSYEIERQAFAKELVATTDRVFSMVTSEGTFANLVRTWVAPALASFGTRLEPVRERAFRVLSQTRVSYPKSPLSRGSAGDVKGGDRLPWVRWNDDDGSRTDNYTPLSAIGWQVHVYGAASDELRAWCEDNRVPLHVYAWRVEHESAGLARDAAYLLRPDTYVAVADPRASPATLQAYVHRLGLTLRPERTSTTGARG